MFFKKSISKIEKKIAQNRSDRKLRNRKQVQKREVELVLDKKYYDFYSIQPVNTKPFYIKSPLFLIIKQYKNDIFKNLVYLFEQMYGYKLKIGIEIEFYIFAKNSQRPSENGEKTECRLAESDKSIGSRENKDSIIPEDKIAASKEKPVFSEENNDYDVLKFKSTLPKENGEPISLAEYNKPIVSLSANKAKQKLEEVINNKVKHSNKNYQLSAINYHLDSSILCSTSQSKRDVPNIDIIKELKKILPKDISLEKEEGNAQFEIKTPPYRDIVKLSSDYKSIINTIKYFCESNNLDFDINPLASKKDCSSALQVNISLVDTDGKNLFSRVDNQESDLLLNSVGGLLKNANNNLLLYINDKYCLKRFELKRNKEIVNSGKYPAPTFISWGVNNRTAAIRIPTPTTTDIKKYMGEDSANRRVEFRIPSSSADIDMVLIGVISSLIEGIEEGLIPTIEKSSYSILEKNDGLEAVEQDYLLLDDMFRVNKDVLYF